MKERKRIFAALVVVAVAAATVAASGLQQPSSRAPLTLQELEALAVKNNPTLRQAAARLRVAEGRRKQAGLYPNPTVGYIAEEVNFGPTIRGGEHGFVVDQEIVLGRKLGRSRAVFAEEEKQAEAAAEAQTLRVINSVRLLFYRALGAEREVKVQTELTALAREAVTVSGQLLNVGQADRPDFLESEVEAQRLELALISARNRQQQVWQQLAAVVGVPALQPAPLAGALDGPPPEFHFEEILERLLRDSPQVRVAQAELDRAERVLKRARIEWIPNLNLRGGLLYNRELLEEGPTPGTRRPVGWEGLIEVGIRLPLFDRNQGNVQSARAEIELARAELDRVRLSLRSTLAGVQRNYLDTVALVNRYRDGILPRAQQAYELYLTRFKQMNAAYPQVLIAQRTWFQLQDEYVQALVNLWENILQIRGFLLMNGLQELPELGEASIPRPGVEVRSAEMPGAVRSGEPVGGLEPIERPER